MPPPGSAMKLIPWPSSVCWIFIIVEKLPWTTPLPCSMRAMVATLKAARNETDHGITFEMATDVFKAPFAIEWLDDREDHGEDRYVIIGMVDNRLIYVAYAMGDEAIRIISARGAEPNERRQYRENYC
jgi:hypothetical protein